MLAQWPSAGPAERLRLRAELDRIERARGFVEARCVLIRFGDRNYSLSELFEKFLDRALETPPQSNSQGDIGLQSIHRDALAALEALRKVHAAPAPVSTPTLNVLLGYAQRILDAWRLSPRVRLRLLTQVLKNIRELEGRVQPDARTGWIVNDAVLPALLGLARRYEDDPPTREAISQAAALLTLPSVLDPRAIAQLASLTSGGDQRQVLTRAYRHGNLAEMGVSALARTVIAQGKDGAAFMAGAAPLLLELFGDARISPLLRGQLIDLVLRQYAQVEPLKPIAEDLLASAYGQPPRPLAEWRKLREAQSGAVERPRAGELFRFLQIVLLKSKPGEPPVMARVVRTDVPWNRPIRAMDGRFVGMLVPAAGGQHADFLGPTPGVRAAADNRLVRRTLQLERIAIRAFGARGEELELCVALPRDGSEPVPIDGARLSHVLDLVRVRLERTQDIAENRALVDLLVRIGTPTSRGMALKYARHAEHASSLLELLEGGDASAAAPLLDRVADLAGPERERAFTAIMARGGAAARARVKTLAGEAPVGLAAPAADALLQSGDADGVVALLQHKDRYARLCGTALALRLTVHAGGLRILPEKPVDVALLARLARKAFPKEMGGCWRRLGVWLPIALEKPDTVRSLRGHESLYAGKNKKVSPARFAQGWSEALGAGKFEKRWPWLPEYVLSPRNPGRGIKPGALTTFLDALEKKARKDPLRRAWIDSLAVLAAVQSGLEFDAEFLRLADARLRRVAGKSTPATARRRPGIAWPIWASADAARQ